MSASAGLVAVVSVDQYFSETSICRSHAVVMSVDPRKNISPLQHFWYDNHNSIAPDCSDLSDKFINNLNSSHSEDLKHIDHVNYGDFDLKVMTYNIWHTNPAAWLYHNPM